MRRSSSGWDDIFAWTTLTESEKAWRSAHHSAAVADLPGLRSALGSLPEHGYEARVQLIQPYVDAVAQDPEGWRALLDAWRAQGLAGASETFELVFGDWQESLVAGVGHLADHAGRQEAWSQAISELAEGRTLSAPVADGCPSWASGAVFTRGAAGEKIDAEVASVIDLEAALLDDLVDARALTADALELAEGTGKDYLMARLNPAELDDDQTRSVGHHAELARRYVIRRDRSKLFGLPDGPGVRHYQALMDTLEGATPDPDRLRPEALEMLQLPARALAALKEGATSTLPDALISDPTVWPMFAESARDGRLSAGDSSHPSATEFRQWIGLQRLLGLLWESRWGDAVSHGQHLVDETADERVQDEALSMTAFAMDQTGRSDAALELLDRALAGSYTEYLLVNASIIASRAKPSAAAALLARLVREAPNRALQTAALHRAIGLWSENDEEFSPELVAPLKVLLAGPIDLPDYVSFARTGVIVAADVVIAMPDLGGEFSRVRRLFVARARFRAEAEFHYTDLASEFLAVYRDGGRPEWFNDEVRTLLSNHVRESMFVEFGQAVGWAQFVDVILTEAPDLLTREDRFVMAAQAGAHISTALHENQNDSLSVSAMGKYFYQPIEEFLQIRGQLDEGPADFIADNFSRVCSWRDPLRVRHA